jgi:hypothetical protein
MRIMTSGKMGRRVSGAMNAHLLRGLTVRFVILFLGSTLDGCTVTFASGVPLGSWDINFWKAFGNADLAWGPNLMRESPGFGEMEQNR